MEPDSGGSRICKFKRYLPRFVKRDLLSGAVLGGVVVLTGAVYIPPEPHLFYAAAGVSLIIGGGVGSYMMYTTKDVAQGLHKSIDRVSVKIDNMSDHLSGKIDNMSDHLSGKIDGVSDKIDNMSDRLAGKIDAQTDILKDIRDSLKPA